MTEGGRPAPRLAVKRWWSSIRPSDRGALRTDAVAGLPVAIGGVPDGMAASVLAGVNPVHGLYASLVAPIAGDDQQHAADGGHHHECSGVGSGVELGTG